MADNTGAVSIRLLRRDELDIVLSWATDEGWNPGLNDADIFWETDPGGFFGFEHNGELVGSISLVTYGSQYGFAGLFIVRPDLRGQGIGAWGVEKIMNLLRERLDPHATIAIDGVYDMQPYYAQLGMVFHHRNIRMAGVGARHLHIFDDCVPATDIPLDELVEYDMAHFGAPRPTFLQAWIHQPGVRALASVEQGTLSGYGVVRPCQQGYKIGPLFANTPEIADRLFRGLSDHAVDNPLYLDTPEVNEAALRLAAEYGLTEVFGCARMSMGPPLSIAWNEVYGVTTFELG